MKQAKIPPLPPGVAEQYEVINWKGGHRQVFGRFGEVDLTTLTPKRAERLIKGGFTKLRRKPKPAPKPAESKKAKKKSED